MKNYLYLVLVSLLLCFSCGEDEITDVRILAEGRWSGTFDGDDSGTWTMNILSNGTLTGELLSNNVPGTAFPGTGMVTENGVINADIMVSTSTSDMTGTIDANNVSGTWSNDVSGISGSWQGSKE